KTTQGVGLTRDGKNQKSTPATSFFDRYRRGEILSNLLCMGGETFAPSRFAVRRGICGRANGNKPKGVSGRADDCLPGRRMHGRVLHRERNGEADAGFESRERRCETSV